MYMEFRIFRPRRVPGQSHWRMSPTGGIKKDARSKTLRDRYHGCAITSTSDDLRNSPAALSVATWKRSRRQEGWESNSGRRLFGVSWLDSAFRSLRLDAGKKPFRSDGPDPTDHGLRPPPQTALS